MTSREKVEALLRYWDDEAKVPCTGHLKMIIGDPYWREMEVEYEYWQVDYIDAAWAYTEEHQRKVTELETELATLKRGTRGK